MTLLFHSRDTEYIYTHRINLLEYISVKLSPRFLIKTISLMVSFVIIYLSSASMGLLVRFIIIFLYTVFLVTFDRLMK